MSETSWSRASSDDNPSDSKRDDAATPQASDHDQAQSSDVEITPRSSADPGSSLPSTARSESSKVTTGHKSGTSVDSGEVELHGKDHHTDLASEGASPSLPLSTRSNTSETDSDEEKSPSPIEKHDRPARPPFGRDEDDEHKAKKSNTPPSTSRSGESGDGPSSEGQHYNADIDDAPRTEGTSHGTPSVASGNHSCHDEERQQIELDPEDDALLSEESSALPSDTSSHVSIESSGEHDGGPDTGQVSGAKVPVDEHVLLRQRGYVAGMTPCTDLGEFPEGDSSAAKIQRLVCRHRAKKQRKRLLRQRNEAATRIQSYVRGHHQRHPDNKHLEMNPSNAFQKAERNAHHVCDKDAAVRSGETVTTQADAKERAARRIQHQLRRFEQRRNATGTCESHSVPTAEFGFTIGDVGHPPELSTPMSPRHLQSSPPGGYVSPGKLAAMAAARAANAAQAAAQASARAANASAAAAKAAESAAEAEEFVLSGRSHPPVHSPAPSGFWTTEGDSVAFEDDGPVEIHHDDVDWQVRDHDGHPMGARGKGAPEGSRVEVSQGSGLGNNGHGRDEERLKRARSQVGRVALLSPHALDTEHLWPPAPTTPGRNRFVRNYYVAFNMHVTKLVHRTHNIGS